MTSLLPNEAFSKVIETIRAYEVFWAFYSSEKYDIGDRWTALAAEYLLIKNSIPYAELREDAMPDYYGGVIFSGGANVGSMRSHSAGLRHKILTQVRNRGLKCIVLPQTCVPPIHDRFPNNTTFFCRDSDSMVEMKKDGKFKNCILAPELTLGFPLDEKQYFNRASNRVGLWLRNDQNGLFPNTPGAFDPIGMVKKSTDYLFIAGTCDVNITDRLHFAIASLLRKRKTILLPISWRKNRSVYVSWLRALGCKWADSVEEAVAISNKEC